MKPVRTTNTRHLPHRCIVPGRMARRRFATLLFVPTLAAELPAPVAVGTATGCDQTGIGVGIGRAWRAGR